MAVTTRAQARRLAKKAAKKAVPKVAAPKVAAPQGAPRRGRAEIRWVGKYTPPGDENCKKVYTYVARSRNGGTRRVYFYNSYTKTGRVKRYVTDFNKHSTKRKFIPAGAFTPL